MAAPLKEFLEGSIQLSENIILTSWSTCNICQSFEVLSSCVDTPAKKSANPGDMELWVKVCLYLLPSFAVTNKNNKKTLSQLSVIITNYCASAPSFVKHYPNGPKSYRHRFPNMVHMVTAQSPFDSHEKIYLLSWLRPIWGSWNWSLINF